MSDETNPLIPAPDPITAPDPTTAPTRYTVPPGHVLIMRVCAPDMTSHGGTFKWPESGPVEASDWKPTPECGNGLHGWLWGAGDVRSCSGADTVDGARWLVAEVPASTIVELGGSSGKPDKIKFPRANVIYCGDVAGATSLISKHAPAGTPVIYGTATAGDRGTATAGYGGTATAGDDGTATAGDGGTVMIKWWDGARGRYRTALGEVGIDGILPGVKYRVEGEKLVAVDAGGGTL